jgi:hypothetical protein
MMSIVSINFGKLSLHSSQIYKLHGFVPNLCEICYFMGSYCLLMHYLNMEGVCMTFVCKQYE